ncbi:phage tail protein [Novosphingobium umbonatum]|uniref:Phage tail protein n=1 Tax=Novosphingobium umbonatum TaxID=1908524 RepID=A0A437N1Y3_9SPHN|nr:phage tail protein [Novosphingobium umbonatum]RVU03934.1 phage tail protein [Novosphingobium umbonatum]
MQKINSLRAALVEAIPGLAADPNTLKIWSDQGSVRTPRFVGSPNGFSFFIRLNVLIIEFTGDIAALSLVLLLWIQQNQPDLLQNGSKDAFTFNVEVLDDATVDIEFKLELKQSVSVNIGADGYTLAYVPEPPPLDQDETIAIPALTAVSVAGEGVVAQSESAANGG